MAEAAFQAYPAGRDGHRAKGERGIRQDTLEAPLRRRVSKRHFCQRLRKALPRCYPMPWLSAWRLKRKGLAPPFLFSDSFLARCLQSRQFPAAFCLAVPAFHVNTYSFVSLLRSFASYFASIIGRKRPIVKYFLGVLLWIFQHD